MCKIRIGCVQVQNQNRHISQWLKLLELQYILQNYQHQSLNKHKANIVPQYREPLLDVSYGSTKTHQL